MANSFETELERPECETLASLAQNLVYRLPGCDDNTIRLALREVYADFCRRSCCLRVRRHFPVERDGVYMLPVAFGGTVRNVTEVLLRGRPLREGHEWQANDRAVFVDSRVTCTELDPCLHGDRHARPDIVEIAWIELPAFGSEKISRDVLARHGEALCSGVLARLLAQTQKPWSDPQLAPVEATRYEAAVNEECQRLYATSPHGSGSLGNAIDTSSLI